MPMIAGSGGFGSGRSSNNPFVSIGLATAFPAVGIIMGLGTLVEIAFNAYRSHQDKKDREEGSQFDHSDEPQRQTDRSIDPEKEKFIKLLIEAGTVIKEMDPKDTTALMQATMSQDSGNIIKMLLDAGSEIQKQDFTPLQKAMDSSADGKNADFLKLLVDAGVDFSKAKENSGNMTPLHVAVKSRDTDIADILLKQEDEKISDGKNVDSALMAALSKGDRAAAKQLIEAGADPNCTISSLYPDTALMRICMMKETDPDLIKTAIDCGADPDFKGVAEIDGQRFENPVAGPRDIVKGLHPDIYPQFITYLKEHGYDVNGDELEEIERFEKERDGIE